MSHFPNKREWEICVRTSNKYPVSGEYLYFPLNEIHWGIIEYFDESIPRRDLLKKEYAFLKLPEPNMLFNTYGKRKIPEINYEV